MFAKHSIYIVLPIKGFKNYTKIFETLDLRTTRDFFKVNNLLILSFIFEIQSYPQKILNPVKSRAKYTASKSRHRLIVIVLARLRGYANFLPNISLLEVWLQFPDWYVRSYVSIIFG